MLLTLEKLKARVPEIASAAVRAVRPIDGVLTVIAPGPVAESTMAPAPPADAPGWEPLRTRQPWGGAPGADPAAPRHAIGSQAGNIAGLLFFLLLGVRKADLIAARFGRALDTNQNVEVELAAEPAQHQANALLGCLGRRRVAHERPASLRSVEQSFAF